jgi:hypothetical protein
MAIGKNFYANITTTERMFCAIANKKNRKAYFCTVNRSQMISAFAALGLILEAYAKGKARPSSMTDLEWESLDALVQKEQHFNGWFTLESIQMAFIEISNWLQEDVLQEWLSSYPPTEKPQNVALILPGNLPLVGFHDLMCVLFSGHKALIKMSSEDARLMPALVQILISLAPQFEEQIAFADLKLSGYDAVIATGSNNSMLHFKQYFSGVPHLLRGHRTSVAVLDGAETQAELTLLGQDIFQYYGRGCRNVTLLLVSKSFDLNRFFEAMVPYADIVNHKKYGNNYDYNKAIHLMNQVPILDNHFLLLKESQDLNSPLGMLHYYRYENTQELKEFLIAKQDQIQCVVGRDFIPFGSAQCPKLNDYADGIDTMQFLGNFAKCLS